jgi:hypothetical protein
VFQCRLCQDPIKAGELMGLEETDDRLLNPEKLRELNAAPLNRNVSVLLVE